MNAVLVTGAGQRIGRALAIGLAQRGYDIYAHYHKSVTEVESLACEIQATGRQCLPVMADLADAEAAGSLLAGCRDLGVRHLVNNAALYADDSPDGFDVGVFDNLVAVNLRAPLILADAFARQAAEGASILNLLDSRIAAVPARYVSYMVTKVGLAAATESLALKYAPAIRVNAIAPGPILSGAIETTEQIKAYQASTPLATALGTADIVEAAIYLLEARAVTGQVLYIDGGHRLTARRSP